MVPRGPRLAAAWLASQLAVCTAAAQAPPDAAQAPPQATASAPSPPAPVAERPPLGIFPEPEDRLMDPRMRRSWGELPARYFLATTIDIGFVYARPRVSVGYGKPFTSWVGIDGNPIASGAGLGAYGGLRLEIPYLDVRLGPRYFFAFNHTYLERKLSYSRLELETSAGRNAQVLTHELEVDVGIPVGAGALIGRGSVSYVTGVPEGMNVFEETLRVIVEPPIVWRARVGYVFRFGTYGQHSVGVVGDLLDVPKRLDTRTLRVGPIVRLVLSRRVDVRGSFVLTVRSPDDIGLIGGDFTELGVRYRWATE